MGAAFGMSGPTLSGSKREDPKAEERTHAPVQEPGNKLIAAKKATRGLTTNLPSMIKEGPFGGR